MHTQSYMGKRKTMKSMKITAMLLTEALVISALSGCGKRKWITI